MALFGSLAIFKFYLLFNFIHCIRLALIELNNQSTFSNAMNCGINVLNT